MDMELQPGGIYWCCSKKNNGGSGLYFCWNEAILVRIIIKKEKVATEDLIMCENVEKLKKEDWYYRACINLEECYNPSTFLSIVRKY